MLNRIKFLRSLRSASLIALTAISVQASTFTFVPNDGEGDSDDMLDLDHYKYFTWGFKNFVVPANEKITSAKISFYNINNWTADENGYWKNGVLKAENWLNIWLLDGVSSTLSSTSGKLNVYNDTDGGPDYFATWGSSSKVKIATYTDWDGGANGKVVSELCYDFSSQGVLDELQAYIANGSNFALGIDPDCHYWNTGVKLVIETKPYAIPDTAGTAGLLGASLGLLVVLRRRLRR